jgi:hypothetical protein
MHVASAIKVPSAGMDGMVVGYQSTDTDLLCQIDDCWLEGISENVNSVLIDILKGHRL